MSGVYWTMLGPWHLGPCWGNVEPMLSLCWAKLIIAPVFGHGSGFQVLHCQTDNHFDFDIAVTVLPLSRTTMMCTQPMTWPNKTHSSQSQCTWCHGPMAVSPQLGIWDWEYIMVDITYNLD